MILEIKRGKGRPAKRKAHDISLDENKTDEHVEDMAGDVHLVEEKTGLYLCL